MFYTYKTIRSKMDASRPFAVVCEQLVMNPIKGRYSTITQANRYRDKLNAEKRAR